MNSLRSELAAFDQNWKDIEINENGNFDPLPDGKYQVAVEEVSLERSKASGRAQVKWTLRVLVGEHKGRLIWRYNGIENFDQATYLKKDLHTCGLDLEKLSDLADRAGELVGVVLEVTLRTKGEFQNCYLNKQIKTPVFSGEQIANDLNDDVPF
ncbi:MAG: DUF669 domain-containing protein [Methanocella sp.]